MAKRGMSTFERLRSGGQLSRQQRRELQQRLSAADPGLEIVHRDAAGIDVGSKSHFAAGAGGAGRTTGAGVRVLDSRLAPDGSVAESLRHSHRGDAVDGVYWIAVQEVLEQAGIEVYLVKCTGDQESTGT